MRMTELPVRFSNSGACFLKKKQNKTYPYHLTGPVDFNICKYFFYMELAVMLVLVIYTETMKSAERFHIILDHILL